LAPKKQKSISVPIDWYIEIEELFLKNEKELKLITVLSVSELIRVLANLGKTKLPKVLESIKTTVADTS